MKCKKYWMCYAKKWEQKHAKSRGFSRKFNLLEATKLFQTENDSARKRHKNTARKPLACTFLTWLCTEVPISPNERKGMIISRYSDMYGKMGNIECAENLFQKLYEVYRPQQQFFESKYAACSVILAEYSKFFGR